MAEPSYRREFWRSPHHAWLALLTLGLGILSAEVLGVILGATAYAIGWIYLPDARFFRDWVHRKLEREARKKAREEMVLFVRRRDALLARLSLSRQSRYSELTKICREIEDVTGGDDDAVVPVLRGLRPPVPDREVRP